MDSGPLRSNCCRNSELLQPCHLLILILIWKNLRISVIWRRYTGMFITRGHSIRTLPLLSLLLQIYHKVAPTSFCRRLSSSWLHFQSTPQSTPQSTQLQSLSLSSFIWSGSRACLCYTYCSYAPTIAALVIYKLKVSHRTLVEIM